MKKIVILFIIFTLIFSTGCVKKQVFYPVPVTFEQTISVSNYSGGDFTEIAVFPATDLNDEIQKSINDLDGAELNNVLLESITYTLLSTNKPNTVASGKVVVKYGTEGPLQLAELATVNFGQILQEPQAAGLDDAAVDLIVQALRDIVFNGVSRDLVIGVNGAVDPAPDNLDFELKVELTVNTIVAQCQEIFDPLGSDNEKCQ